MLSRRSASSKESTQSDLEETPTMVGLLAPTTAPPFSAPSTVSVLTCTLSAPSTTMTPSMLRPFEGAVPFATSTLGARTMTPASLSPMIFSPSLLASIVTCST